MTNKEIVISVHRSMGRNDALSLRGKAIANEITDTDIIENEHSVPKYDPKKDYTQVPIGSPYKFEGQVYALIQPHNAAWYTNIAPGTEGGAPFWRIKHTKNPKNAKPWVQPTATSLYLEGECMIWTDGNVMRAKRDTNFSPVEYPLDWEVVIA